MDSQLAGRPASQLARPSGTEEDPSRTTKEWRYAGGQHVSGGKQVRGAGRWGAAKK